MGKRWIGNGEEVDRNGEEGIGVGRKGKRGIGNGEEGMEKRG